MTFPVQLLSQFTQPAFQQLYTTTNTPGFTADFTVPDGVFTLSAVAVGAGGGGSGGGTGGGVGGGRSGGGGGGGLTWGIFSVQPGDILTVNIGVGGNGGVNNSNGTNGGDSSVILKSRGGVTLNETIILAQGGRAGTKGGGSGGGGTGIQPDPFFPTNFQMLLRGGGNGGDGGNVDDTVTNLGAGGGGAAGYNGNGGIGGGNNPIQPTAAATASGGGGGGGRQSGTAPLGAVGWGGGGVGLYGFDGISEGIAGVNNGSGGGGGSQFNDPGDAVAAEFVGSASTDQTFISYSNIKDNSGNPVTLSDNDFLLLLSAADSTVPGAPTLISVPDSTDFPPVGFTTLVRTNDGEYITASEGPFATQVRTIPDISNTTNTQVKSDVSYTTTGNTRDINFANSFAYIPPGGLTSPTLQGLAANCIHNLIVLRYVPGTAEERPDIIWRNTSGDPGINPPRGCRTLMPEPPTITNAPAGSISIISGYLANCVLNPGSVAGNNSLVLNSITGGVGGVVGEGVGIAAQYTLSEFQNTGATVGGRPVVSTTFPINTAVDPDIFLTGTSAHSRCYTLELQRTDALNPITLVGTAATASFFLNGVDDPDNFVSAVNSSVNINDPNSISGSNFPLPTGTQNGDLIICAAALDAFNAGPQVNPDYNGPGGGSFTPWRTNIFADEGSGDGNRFNNDSSDPRGVGGMGFYVGYDFATTTGSTIDLNFDAGDGVPTAVLILVFRNATPVTTGGNTYRIWDNRTSDPYDPDSGNATSYGAPDPGIVTTSSANSAVLSIAMIDNIGISNISTIQPPPGYSGLAATSYGVPNDGAVVMSAIKSIETSGEVNPDAFIGNGGNIWASQNLIIGGPGKSNLSGTNLRGGIYGGGGGGYSANGSGNGNPGGSGAVRLLWGSGRAYPLTSQGTGNVGSGITSWVV